MMEQPKLLEEPKLPTDILKNRATGRFHPIIYRRAPMPGGRDEDQSVQRYRSLGHHTDGFATHEEATQHILSNPRYRPPETVLDWAGDSVPAVTRWFVRETPSVDQPRTAVEVAAVDHQREMFERNMGMLRVAMGGDLELSDDELEAIEWLALAGSRGRVAVLAGIFASLRKRP